MEYTLRFSDSGKEEKIIALSPNDAICSYWVNIGPNNPPVETCVLWVAPICDEFDWVHSHYYTPGRIIDLVEDKRLEAGMTPNTQSSRKEALDKFPSFQMTSDDFIF